MCRHTREPAVLSRVSCRPSHLNVDRFHQPCLLPWRAPYCHRNTAGLGRDRWGLSSPYHVTGTYPFGAARLFLLRDSLATPTRRYHGRMLIHPLPPACGTPLPKKCLHTRRFGTLASLPPPVVDLPWGPHLPDHPHTQTRIVLFHCLRISILNWKPSHNRTSIGFSQIAFTITVLSKDDQKDSAQEEQLGLRYWTMI